MQPLQSWVLLNGKRKCRVLSLRAGILCTWVCSKLLSTVPGRPVLSCRCFAAHGGTVAEPDSKPNPVCDSNDKPKCITDTDAKLNALAIADAKPDPFRNGHATDTDAKFNALAIANAKPDPVRDCNATDADAKPNALAVTHGSRLALVIADSGARDLVSFEHSLINLLAVSDSR